MIPDVVADVGNTRIKWGVLADDEPRFNRLLSLSPDLPAWEQAREALGGRRLRWAVASVQPARSDRLLEWLRGRGDEVTLLRHEHLPVSSNVEDPRRVGIDRLLNAVAARAALAPGEPAVLVDAGSAVTVDYLDGSHVFQGGTIFPGLDLMAEALHRYTALLPRVEVKPPFPPVPAKATVPAIQAGILAAVQGGIEVTAAAYVNLAQEPLRRFLTGGQAAPLRAVLGWDESEVWPDMTLMGILVACRGLP